VLAAVDACRTTRWPDREIGEIAARELSLITRLQLMALGLTRSDIDYSLARGRLRLIHRGVYAVGHQALTEQSAALAAVLAVGTGAFVSHHSAAALWGMATRRRGDVQVTLVARDAGRRRPGIEVHQAKTLDRQDVTTRFGTPIVSAARALLTITPALSDRELERIFDNGLKRRLFTRAAVAGAAGRSSWLPGAARLAALAADELRVPRITRSDAEEKLLALIRAAGLPMPEVNARLGRYEIDFLWRTLQLAVEVDGYEFHSTRRSFEADHARDLELESAGFHVMRFTRDQVVHQPELVLARIAQRIGELGAQSRPSSRPT
jgi:very-short-patch-repair endonuclease